LTDNAIIKKIKASQAFELSAITEASAGVVGDEIRKLETWQDFTEKGTSVVGGTSAARVWADKSYVPLTVKTQCIDCLHCVVACPHHAIDHDIRDEQLGTLVRTGKKLASIIPGFNYDPATDEQFVGKGSTDYSFCKGCFVCASACPTGAIHFVPKNQINYETFKGAPLEPEKLKDIFVAPVMKNQARIKSLVKYAEKSMSDYTAGALMEQDLHLFNGSEVLSRFVFQAQFDSASMYPITPNTGLLKYLEAHVKSNPDSLDLRTCLSEESGYAWLTGSSVQGKRCLMAQGSQSMAQLFEFMNINPGLHLPVFMFEMTRALAPGTSIKPDHTTTMRTADTGEIIIFGRGLQENYDRSLLLLKLMESEGVWVPGRLIVKGFVETHAISTQKQANVKMLSDEQVRSYLGKAKNPFVFKDGENLSVGTLDFDARYAEQRQAIDEVLIRAGQNFDDCAANLEKVNGRPAIQKVERYPQHGVIDFCLVSLNDPDLNTAEYVCDELRAQGINAGVISINLYRPFPAKELRDSVRGCQSIGIIDYSNRSGRSGGAALADEVRSALYQTGESPELFAVQMGLGGRAVTIPNLLLLNRILADLAQGKESTAAKWFQDKHPDRVFSLGSRGNELPQTDAKFEIDSNQRNIHETVIVGKGGQGVLLLNSLLSGIANLRGDYAVSMVGYGALQRGGGITLSFKHSQEKIRDYSDIVMPDTLVAFEDDIHLSAMLSQLKPGGTLILDGDLDKLNVYQERCPQHCKVVVIPARALANEIYGNANKTNVILFGALCAHHGIENEATFLNLIDNMVQISEIRKEAGLLKRSENHKGAIAGFVAYQKFQEDILALESQPVVEDPFLEFQEQVLPAAILKVVDNPTKLAKLKKKYALKKSIYKKMFQFHPMVSQIQSMYIKLKGRTPVSGGDMACGGCGQINIFRNVLNFMEYLQDEKGKIYISEQDGCGTVFSGLNRTSIWNTPYIRIAFETAHGVASGLASGVSDDDIVVSIAGDGGMMQGIRSVEDSLHQQDPIFHIVVINQVLGNTGGQAAATTMKGARTREGHEARRESMNFLKLAEKHCVEGAVATSVHLHDLQEKIRWGHRVVKEEKRPFMLVMNFSCLEQGVNLAESLIQQKRALDAHYFNLYSLKFKNVKNSDGQLLYRKKKIQIDWFPWTFGKKNWKKKLKTYASKQSMMKAFTEDEAALESGYGQLRGNWMDLKQEMGTINYHWALFKNIFSMSRATMARLIRKSAPDQALKK